MAETLGLRSQPTLGRRSPRMNLRRNARQTSSRTRDRLRAPACLRRRRVAPRLSRDPAEPGPEGRDGLSGAGGRLVRATGRHGAAGDDRQRLGPQLQTVRHSAPPSRLKHVRTRPYTPAHQRQGRALHRDQLVRMGLRSTVRLVGRTSRRRPTLGRRLQPPPTPLRPPRRSALVMAEQPS